MSQATNQSADALYDLLRAIDDSSRLDMNPVPTGSGGHVYEVRIYGKHVGFVEIGSDGLLVAFI